MRAKVVQEIKTYFVMSPLDVFAVLWCLLAFRVLFIGFGLIMRSIAEQRDVEEPGVYSDFEKIEGGCTIVNTKFKSSGLKFPKASSK